MLFGSGGQCNIGSPHKEQKNNANGYAAKTGSKMWVEVGIGLIMRI